MSIRDGQEVIEKYRFPKKYRHPDLDKRIRAQRTRGEARILQRLSEAGVAVPRLVEAGGSTVVQERVAGRSLAELHRAGALGAGHLAGLGRLARAAHDAGVVHNDLTLANVLLDQGGRLVLLDFGLAQVSASAEHRAVDLYVLERGLAALTGDEALFDAVLDSYGIASDPELLNRLHQVRMRGRKK